MSEWDGALRLLVAMVLCSALGFERELRRKDAGMRTFALVGTGAALFTVVGPALARSGSNVEPTRIAAQVASGVGFLGVGLILRQGTRVRNLTTAAEVWATAAIGVAVGAGLYVIAVATTLLILIILPTYGARDPSFERPGGSPLSPVEDADAPNSGSNE